ncbi:MAG: hypothetical protein D6739_07105, partial [Nitrospirae bacterium]
AKVAAGEVEGRVDHLAAELEAVRAEEARGRRERAEKCDRAAALDRAETEARGRIESLEGRLAETLEAEEAARAALQGHLDRCAEVEGEVERLAAEERRLQGEREALQEELRGLEQQLSELRHQTAELRLRFQERYHTEPEAARDAAGPAEVELAEMERQIPELARKLERIGPVNLTAIEEHRELEERLAFLNRQRQDLEAAIEDIRQAIRRINRTSRERFLTTFEQIDRHFAELFTHLFEGGTAHLHLVDPDNPLESGIEITAQPPGKKNQTIGLLSGGEKALTTLALIFSTYRVRPAPFCLLDEVDAPLDDANVLRFNRLLRGLAETTQFPPSPTTR